MRRRIVEDPADHARQPDEAAGRQLDADGVAHHVLQHVGLVEDGEVVLRQDHAATGDVEPVQVGVDDHDVGDGRPPAGLLGEARIAERAAVGAGALVAADADGSPRGVGRGPLELGGVAGLRVADPLGDLGDLRLRGRRHALQLELGAVAAARQLAQALQADVVATPLQHRPVEAVGHRALEEREVLRRQLVLEGLGRRGHDDADPRLDGRNEVGQRLAGPGAGLHDEVPTGGDGRGDGLGHLGLPRTCLRARQGGGDVGQRRRDVAQGLTARGPARRPARRRRTRATSCP